MRLWHKEDITDLVQVCVILRNMVVEARRDEYGSGMWNLVFLDDPTVQSVRADIIYCSTDQTMPIIS